MIKKELLGEYQNGNYNVQIYADGTKIRETDDNKFIAAFPESMDLKITNMCDVGCAFCHEKSVPTGKHGDILNLEFINTLHPFTEVAIGGGDPLAHPNLIAFLFLLQRRHIIANITIHHSAFLQNLKTIDDLIKHKLIWGLGVSVIDPTEEFLSAISGYENAVVHVINGVIPIENLRKMYDQNIKVLILGYKQFGRGKAYFCAETTKNMMDMHRELPTALNHFAVLSFDNLAVYQLQARRLVSVEEWQERFMGDDGHYTMYIDAVEQKFAKNSTSEFRSDLLDNIGDMFLAVKNNANKTSIW